MITDSVKKLACEKLGGWENCKLHAYKDDADVITIGIGIARFYPDGRPIKIGDTCTLEQAHTWLNQHLEKSVYGAVKGLCEGIEVPERILVALCSLAYNTGAGVLSKPSFTVPVKAKDWGTWEGHIEEGKYYITDKATGLASTFVKYDKITVNGVKQTSKGLHNRRVKEVKFMLGIK